MSIQLNRENGPNETHGRKWYMRLIALLLAVLMVISAVVYNNISSEVGELAPASFSEEGDQVVLEPGSIQVNMDAIRKARVLQRQLTDDYEKSQQYISDGEYEKAIEPTAELYSYLSEDETVGVYLRTTLSQLYFMTGDYENCSEICEDMLERQESTDGTIEFMDGICKMQTQDYASAVTHLQTAIDRGYSQEMMCRAQIALASIYQQKYDDAKTYAAQVLEGEHDSSLDEILYYITAMSSLQQQSFEEAAEQFDQLLKIAPDGEYYYYRGVAYMGLEDYEKAAADFESALLNDYEETGCYYDLGLCSYYMDDPDKTEENMKTVVQRGDDETYTEAAQEILEAIGESN